MKGFTISYLAKVQQIEEKAQLLTTQIASEVGEHDGENKQHKVDRLMSWAILQLFEDGQLMPWDGPARSHPSSSDSIPFLKVNY